MGQQTSRQLGLTGMDVAGLARTSISTLTLSKRERHSAWLDNKIARLLKVWAGRAMHYWSCTQGEQRYLLVTTCKLRIEGFAVMQTLAQTRSGRVKTLNQILLKFGQLNEGFQCSRTIFNKIDKQSRGQLSMQDVQKAAMEANLGLDNDTIVKLFDSADLEGTHQLEFREFVLVIAAVYIFRVRDLHLLMDVICTPCADGYGIGAGWHVATTNEQTFGAFTAWSFQTNIVAEAWSSLIVTKRVTAEWLQEAEGLPHRVDPAIIKTMEIVSLCSS